MRRRRRRRRHRRRDRPARSQGRRWRCKELYAELTPWQKTQVARHPQRPHCLDYIAGLITDFMPFAGDRKFGEDEAIVGGFGRFRGESVCVHRPRKGLRHREPAQAQFRHGAAGGLPQGGAADGDGRPLRHPGDLRWSIPPAPIPASTPRSAARPKPSPARPKPASISACPTSRSSSAKAARAAPSRIATANRVLMLEHAIYSVISPEGAASILWRDTTKAQDAATNMKITAQDMVALRRHRRDRPRADRRRPPRSGRRHRRRPARRSPRRFAELKASTATPCAGSAATSSSPWAAAMARAPADGGPNYPAPIDRR